MEIRSWRRADKLALIYQMYQEFTARGEERKREARSTDSADRRTVVSLSRIFFFIYLSRRSVRYTLACAVRACVRASALVSHALIDTRKLASINQTLGVSSRIESSRSRGIYVTACASEQRN